MKRRSQELHIPGAEQEDKSEHRITFYAFVLACLISTLIILLLSAIHTHIKTGSWPLFH